MHPRSIAVLLSACLIATAGAGPGSADPLGERQGRVSFPRDEHFHADGWDYWWGGIDLTTETGNRYSIAVGINSVNGNGGSNHQVFAWQEPYLGKTIATSYGQQARGNGGERYLRVMSAWAPGASEPLSNRTIHPTTLKLAGLWERTTMAAYDYRFLIDDAAARIHPAGDRVRLLVDLDVSMHHPPLLVGGDGAFWYGVPDGFGYPSRSFQYQQVARRLDGVVEIESPDGSIVREQVDSRRSTMALIHEFDAEPEDLGVGLGLVVLAGTRPGDTGDEDPAGGTPWDLYSADLGGGVQVFAAVMSFHRAAGSPISEATGFRAHRAMATVRLPTGESVALDEDRVVVEHLDYRTYDGEIPQFASQTTGTMTQAWRARLRYPGGRESTWDGRTVDVPGFDLALVPRFGADEPELDAAGNGLRTRLVFDVSGTFGGCRVVDGFAFSEILTNWHQRESSDPWFTRGRLPTPGHRCPRP